MALDHDLSILSVLWKSLAAVIVARTLYGAIWRLFLSPIASFPGPKFAALTLWNEFYYDVVLAGQYTRKLEDYHRQYGPIVRINPYELHIRDSAFFDELYVGSSKRKTNKYSWAMRMFAQEDSSIFDTLDHDKHRRRREPWNHFFSKQSVSRLQPTLIQPKVDKLCKRLQDHQTRGKPVQMVYAYATVTVDIISDYTYPEGYNYLDLPEFDHQNYDAFMGFSLMCHTMKQFRILIPILKGTPLWLLKHLNPNAHSAMAKWEHLLEQAEELQQRKKSGIVNEAGRRASLLEAIMNSNLPESDKASSRIADEAQTAIAAGTLTSGHALKHATYHILANPPIHSRLMKELETAMPDSDSPLALKELETLPYLQAIMYESLRGFHGTSHRLQRIFPTQPLHYKSWVIPPGTPVGMTGVHMHNDPDIFPEPYAYRPERWLPWETQGQGLVKYIASFGKGSRKCIGIELAKAEILTTLASVFRRFGHQMVLWDTQRERDIDFKRDFFNPMPSKESKGLRVLFKRD